MSIFERYITRSLLAPIIFIMAILSSILWFSQMLRLINLFDKNISLIEFISTSFLIVPFLMHSVLPFSVIYSVIYVFNNFKINKELVILEVNGFKRDKLIYPVLKLCSIVAFLGLFNSSFIMPLAYSNLKNKIYTLNSKFISSIIQPKVFNNLSKTLVLYVDSKNIRKDMKGIILFDYKDAKNTIIYISKSGSIEFNNEEIILSLKMGSRQSFGKLNSKEIINFDKFTVKTSTANFDTRKKRDNLELIIWDLLFPLFKSENLHNSYIAEGHNRILWPLMSIILPMISLSYFLRLEFNRKNYITPLVKSFFAGIIFVIIHLYLVSLASNNLSIIKYLYFNYLSGIILSLYLIYYDKKPKYF